jgi:hypothetical protein
MTVYVDNLESWGWKMRGHTVKSCHMFVDTVDLSELHLMAEKIGMKREWFQPHKTAPHYDLTKTRRELAVNLGAVEVDRRTASSIWKKRRELLATPTTMDIFTNEASKTSESMDTTPNTNKQTNWGSTPCP